MIIITVILVVVMTILIKIAGGQCLSCFSIYGGRCFCVCFYLWGSVLFVMCLFPLHFKKKHEFKALFEILVIIAMISTNSKENIGDHRGMRFPLGFCRVWGDICVFT